ENHAAVSGSPYIVHLYGYWTDKSTDVVWITLEFCEGGELTSLVDHASLNTQPLDEQIIWMYLFQIASALQHCHQLRKLETYQSHRMVVHGDLKLPNILMNKAKTVVKIADFGLSVALKSDERSRKQVGTLDYIAPELCPLNDKDIRFASPADIWSLGVIGKELCNLCPTFADDDDDALKAKIRSGETAPIPGHYSPELDQVLNAMLTVDPRLRPTAEELLSLPGFKLGNAFTELHEQDITIATLQRQVENQSWQLSQYEEAAKQQDNLAAVVERQQHDIETLQKLLQHANDTAEARRIVLEERNQSLAQREHQLASGQQELQLLQAALSRAQAQLEEDANIRGLMLNEREAALNQRDVALTQRDAALDRRERDVSIRERAPARAVADLTDSCLPHEKQPKGGEARKQTTTRFTAIPRPVRAFSDSLRHPSAQSALCASFSATSRLVKSLPHRSPQAVGKPSLPTGTRNAAKSTVRKEEVEVATSVKKETAPSASTAVKRQVHTRLAVPTVSVTSRAGPMHITKPKACAVQATAACSVADGFKHRICSAEAIRKTGRTALGQALAEPARKLTTGQIRDPDASKNAKSTSTPIPAVLEVPNITTASSAILQPPEIASIPLPSWTRGMRRRRRIPRAGLL
ncbi:hypothetical protein NCC49_006587, partial [Naganishia albida]